MKISMKYMKGQYDNDIWTCSVSTKTRGIKCFDSFIPYLSNSRQDGRVEGLELTSSHENTKITTNY